MSFRLTGYLDQRRRPLPRRNGGAQQRIAPCCCPVAVLFRRVRKIVFSSATWMKGLRDAAGHLRGNKPSRAERGFKLVVIPRVLHTRAADEIGDKFGGQHAMHPFRTAHSQTNERHRRTETVVNRVWSLVRELCSLLSERLLQERSP